jgi:hypothetical protein
VLDVVGGKKVGEGRRNNVYGGKVSPTRLGKHDTWNCQPSGGRHPLSPSGSVRLLVLATGDIPITRRLCCTLS